MTACTTHSKTMGGQDLERKVKELRQTWESIYLKPLESGLQELEKVVPESHHRHLEQVKRLYQILGFQAMLALLDGEDVDLDKLEPPYYISFSQKD